MWFSESGHSLCPNTVGIWHCELKLLTENPKAAVAWGPCQTVFLRVKGGRDAPLTEKDEANGPRTPACILLDYESTVNVLQFKFGQTLGDKVSWHKDWYCNPCKFPMRRWNSYMSLHVGRRFKNHIPVINSIRNSILFPLDCNTKSRNVKGENVLHWMQKTWLKKP